MNYGNIELNFTLVSKTLKLPCFGRTFYFTKSKVSAGTPRRLTLRSAITYSTSFDAIDHESQITSIIYPRAQKERHMNTWNECVAIHWDDRRDTDLSKE